MNRPVNSSGDQLKSTYCLSQFRVTFIAWQKSYHEIHCQINVPAVRVESMRVRRDFFNKFVHRESTFIQHNSMVCVAARNPFAHFGKLIRDRLG
jgi:hypothetical protein